MAFLFRYMYKKNYPLPSVSTLKWWVKKIHIQPGVLHSVFKMIENINLTPLERVCVLSFDEMKVKKEYSYDKTNDETLNPSNYVQVVMAKGLFSKWKQPLYYGYDQKMTKEILFEIMNKLNNIGFDVVATVCDLGGTNRSLLKELGINENNTSFTHPSDDLKKVFVFADVPHLIKLLRNHLIDDGYNVDGKLINVEPIARLINVTENMVIKTTHKVTTKHLSAKNAQRQKVSLATQLLSHSVAKAIKRNGDLGIIKASNYNECSNFIKTVNDWFDIFNRRVPGHDQFRSHQKAFGLALEEQINHVQKMSELMTKTRACNKKALLPFQKGILISNRSLPLLHTYLKERYKISYILTYNLNQDVLENFFSQMRAGGGLNDHPSGLDFKYRLRSYLLGRNDTMMHASSNIEDSTRIDDEDSSEPNDEHTLSGELIKNLNFDKDELEDDENDVPICTDTEFTQLEMDGLEGLAGFIAHKLRKKDQSLGSICVPNTNSWVGILTEGGLTKPHSEFLNHIKNLEQIFRDINRPIKITKHFMKFHLQKSDHINCTLEAKKLFFRCRMYFTLRELNRSISQSFTNNKI